MQLDVDDSDAQTLLLEYPSHFQTHAPRYVRPVVKIEFGARSDPWPAAACLVRPVMAEQFPQVLEGSDAMVHALAAERTFWEKAMLLHEETYRPAGKTRRPRMARHYYDLYRLIEHGVGVKALKDQYLFEQVAAHRQVFFAQTWVDYATLQMGSLRIVPLPEQEAAWRQDYTAMQGEMFSVAPPAFDVVLEVIAAFEAALSTSRRPGSARGRF